MAIQGYTRTRDRLLYLHRVIWIFQRLWTYRNEIFLAIQVLSALRKTAQEFARDYIRKQVETRLRKQIWVVLGQIALLGLAFLLTQVSPGLPSVLLASMSLWVLTIFNLYQLIFSTIPELVALHRTLKGKIGYAMKYFLEVSVVTELLRLNVLFLFVCLALGISTRTVVGAAFSYCDPWVKLWNGTAHSSRLNLK